MYNIENLNDEFRHILSSYGRWKFKVDCVFGIGVQNFRNLLTKFVKN
jgi:hypothetical protein